MSVDHHGDVVEFEVATGVALHLAGRFLGRTRQMEGGLRWYGTLPSTHTAFQQPFITLPVALQACPERVYIYQRSDVPSQKNKIGEK